jgi:peptidyl-prolyl cis-trans isomerase-like protein 2
MIVCSPITCKLFTDNAYVVAIKTTGNVYSYEAINELNLKPKHFVDLISGDPFSKNDIVTLQNPQDPAQMARRDINNFEHLKSIREQNAENRKSESKLRPNSVAESVMKEIEIRRSNEQLSGVKRKTTDEILQGLSTDFTTDVETVLELRPTIEDVNPGQVNTDGRASASLTSSATGLWTGNATRLAAADEIREAKWKIMRSLGRKAFVQLQTTVGNLNLEIHCDIAMRTSWNFIALCNQGYYDGTVFHRLIPGFMVQGGDPSGTGSGGVSAFNGPFRDEFDSRLTHDARGIVSMANSGVNTNNSQFFITFKEAKHLDLKHAVFGRVVGGLVTLDRIEQVFTDRIRTTVVYKDSSLALWYCALILRVVSHTVMGYFLLL